MTADVWYVYMWGAAAFFVRIEQKSSPLPPPSRAVDSKSGLSSFESRHHDEVSTQRTFKGF